MMTHETALTRPDGEVFAEGGHVCPVWVARLLASPLRRLLDDPLAILRPYLRPGMTVVDAGCAVGFFTLPMARLVGSEGRVVALDLQPELLELLEKRARKAELAERIETRACTANDTGLEDLAGTADFVLAAHVAHEAPDARLFLEQLHAVLEPGGRLLLAEPTGHVSQRRYQQIVAAAGVVGLQPLVEVRMRMSRAVLFERPTSGRGARRVLSPLTGYPLL